MQRKRKTPSGQARRMRKTKANSKTSVLNILHNIEKVNYYVASYLWRAAQVVNEFLLSTGLTPRQIRLFYPEFVTRFRNAFAVYCIAKQGGSRA